MKIVIETSGSFDGTKISIDGKALENLSKFSFSLRIDENGVKRLPKAQASFTDGTLPLSLYGADFMELTKKN